MTKQESNKKARQLFNKWVKCFRGGTFNGMDEKEYYKRKEEFKEECREFHNVVGVYEVLTDKNALKMASICAGTRFVQPYQMLYALQKTTKTY